MKKSNPIANCGLRIADCSNPKSKIQNPKSGVTLLEVLVSTFVLAVGLMGLASLLPVAKYYSVETSKYDRAATLGQAVYHDMQIHDYLLPKRWLDTNPAVPPRYAVQVNTASIPITSYVYNSVLGGPFLPPVVIDPLAISSAAINGQIPPPVFPAFPVPVPVPGLPPVQVPGAPAICRVTLDVNRSWLAEDPVPATGFTPVTMSFPTAQRLFVSNDDLIFELPANADYRPQVVNASGIPLPTPDFQGDYSWLLTVSPDIDDLYHEDMAGMDRFTVSVVIFYKRDLNLDQNPNPATTTLDVKKAPPERMVYADLLDASAQAAATGAVFPFGINFSGGAVRLRTPAPGAAAPPVTAAWLDVKPNEWLMISGFMYNPFASVVPPIGPSPIYAPVPGVAPPGLQVPFCQWYRIAGAGETLPISGGGGWYRDVQLAGPDWNNAFFCPPVGGVGFQYLAPDQPNAYQVQYQYATLATGAIAVYEYQITLDESLLKD